MTNFIICFNVGERFTQNSNRVYFFLINLFISCTWALANLNWTWFLQIWTRHGSFLIERDLKSLLTLSAWQSFWISSFTGMWDWGERWTGVSSAAWLTGFFSVKVKSLDLNGTTWCSAALGILIASCNEAILFFSKNSIKAWIP